MDGWVCMCLCVCVCVCVRICVCLRACFISFQVEECLASILLLPEHALRDKYIPGAASQVVTLTPLLQLQILCSHTLH